MQEEKNYLNQGDARILEKDLDDMVLVEKIDELIKDEKYREQLAQSNKKAIAVGQMKETMKVAFAHLIGELNNLREEVLNKKEGVLSKSFLINKRVEDLLHSGKIHIDQQEYKKSEVSVAQYTSLLDGIYAELESEVAFFKAFSGDKCPGYVVVGKNATDSFNVAAEEKIKAIKRHIKTIGRDLSVSYSRYCYGFDSQVKRIDHVESLVKKTAGVR